MGPKWASTDSMETLNTVYSKVEIKPPEVCNPVFPLLFWQWFQAAFKLAVNKSHSILYIDDF